MDTFDANRTSFVDEPAHWPRAAGLGTAACILVVEDDGDMRRLIARGLRRSGFAALEADGADEAADWLDLDGGAGARRFDLVVSDVRMPGPSGLELLARIRAADPGLPVILITAFGSDETHRAAHRLGAVVLDKPFAIDHLAALAARLVGEA